MMASRGRHVLFLLVVALSLLASEGRAEYPVPRVRETPDSLEVATRAFEAGRWEEAVEGFEAASREGAAALPAAALRRWGIAASEVGRPLAAYIRLRQYLTSDPEAQDRLSLAERVSRAREALRASAARFSRLLVSAERRPDEESAGERHVVRVAAREGDVSLEGLSGLRIEAPLWRRAEEIKLAPYVDLVRRLLDAPAVIDDVPAQTFDPNDPGPRRAVVLRLVVGEEERRLEALRGEAYAQLRGVVDVVLEFAHRAPALWDPEPKSVSPATPRSGKKRR